MAWTRQRITHTSRGALVPANPVGGAPPGSRRGGAGRGRSARQDDLTLLRQFGQPGSAYSGAPPRLLRYIHRTARIVNLYAGTTGGYYRNWSRAEPYNLYAYPRDLLATAASAS